MTGLRAHARALGIVLTLTSLAAHAAMANAADAPATSATPASPPGPAPLPAPATSPKPAPAKPAPATSPKPAPAKPAPATSPKPAPAKPAPAAQRPAAHKPPPPKPPPHKPAPAKPSAAKPGAAKPGASPHAALPATAAAPKAGAPGPTRDEDPKGRRAVAGGSTLDEAALGAESAELGALHDAERELFPPGIPPLGTPWPKDEPSPMATEGTPPRPHSSGPPPKVLSAGGASGATDRDLSWLEGLELPELPVRWDARLVRYLEFWRDDPRGHAMFATWLRRSGRYRDTIRKTLAKKGLPGDLVWLAMVESGFDPKARSPVGALGMWQFMPGTGRIYGLSQDRWADQRIHVPSATEAAADFLADLYRRFGTWELAMASYNMGYGGITGVVKKYNSNDYWALSHLEGSLPWETTLYVPKILSCAIVGRNLARFGFQAVELEAPVVGDEVVVPPGTPLATVAQAAGCKPKEVEALNPELRAGRTPPTDGPGYAVRVPPGRGPACAQALAKQRGVPADRYVVKTGESLSDIADSHRVATSRLVELNGIAPGEVLHGGTVLLVPAPAPAPAGSAPATTPGTPAEAPAPSTSPEGERPVVIVPADVYVYPDRTRVFYRVKTGDTAGSLAEAFGVTSDELRRWNALDLRARLLEGMTLQVFVADREKLAQTRWLSEGSVRTVVAGSEEFFAHFEEKGRRRIVVQAAAGETLEVIGKRHGVSAKLMERINRRGKSEPLAAGESVVLYVPHNDGPRPGELAARADVLPLPPP